MHNITLPYTKAGKLLLVVLLACVFSSLECPYAQALSISPASCAVTDTIPVTVAAINTSDNPVTATLYIREFDVTEVTVLPSFTIQLAPRSSGSFTLIFSENVVRRSYICIGGACALFDVDTRPYVCDQRGCDITLDFESLSHGQLLGDEYAVYGIRFTSDVRAQKKPNYDYTSFPPHSGDTVVSRDVQHDYIEVALDTPAYRADAWYTAFGMGFDGLYLEA